MHRSYGPCSNCQGGNLYLHTEEVSAGGGYAPNYLAGLGKWYAGEKFNVVVCADCGLTRLFARSSATERLSESKKWQRV